MADEKKTTEIASTNGPAQVSEVVNNRSFDAVLFDDKKFERMMMMAEIMCKGATTIPKHLAGNQSDCMAICMQAANWGLSPFVVAQKTHLVNGTLGYEAQLVNAVITNSGAIKGNPRYVYLGDWDNIEAKGQWSPADEEGLGVKVICTMRSDGTEREWTTWMKSCKVRNSPNWKSKPKLQCSYQAIKEWCRVHSPGTILGAYTDDEIQENPITEIRTFDDMPQGESQADKLSAILEDDKGEPVKVEAPPEEPKEKKKEKEVEKPKPKSKGGRKSKLQVTIEGLPAPLDAETVMKYLIEKGVLAEGQMFNDMSDQWKTYITDNTKAFEEALSTWMQ